MKPNNNVEHQIWREVFDRVEVKVCNRVRWWVEVSEGETRVWLGSSVWDNMGSSVRDNVGNHISEILQEWQMNYKAEQTAWRGKRIVKGRFNYEI